MINVVSRDRLRNLADFLLPVLLMAAILSATSLLGHVRLKDATADIERETHLRLEQIAEVDEIGDLLGRIHAELHRIVMPGVAPGPDPAAQALAALWLDNQLAALETRFDAIGVWSTAQASHAQAKASLQSYRTLVLPLLATDALEPRAAALDLAHADRLHNALVRHTEELAIAVTADAAEKNADAIHIIQRRLDQSLSTSLTVIVLTLLLAFTLAKRLANDRNTLADALRRMAQDQLEAEHYEALTRLAAKKGDRLGELAQALLGFREARLAQKDDETLMKAVIEQAPCAIELVDPVTLRFLRANAYSRQALGYTEAELRQRSVMDIQAELQPAQLEALARDIVARRSANFETVHRASDGRLLEARVHIRVIRLHGQDYLLGIWQDVSAEHQALQALKKFSMAIEQSPNAVLITDTEARIEYVNDAFLHTSGYTRAEVIGRNPRLLKSDKTPAEVYAQLWDALVKGEPWRGELVNRRKDGGEYIEQAQISPIRQPDGRITHYLAIKQDITEKRRMLEELEHHRHHLEQLVAERSAALHTALDAAEVANRAKSEFLANMSHEIRTPLNAIIGLGHLLARDLREDEQKARLEKIITAARHLLQIINDILDLSKIEAGRLDLEANDFDPGAMLEGTLELVREQAEQKGLQLSLDLDMLPSRVRGDALRLGQIVLNFASNAVKFTPHGSVAIRGRVLSTAGEQSIVRFEVADTGIGVDASQCERMFQPFEQADPSTTRKYGGTGLGLAISRRLTELMGGRIGVDSTLGKGSTFWVEVPLQLRPASAGRQPSAAAGAPPCAEHDRLCGRRILLAEDNPVNREVAVAILRGTGAVIDTAENGQEAVDMASTTRYDLILMDMQMPVMDGITATRLLRSRDELRKLPILAMTANAFAEDRQRCIDAGMNDHITKPVEPQALCEKIWRWLPTDAPAADLPTPPAVQAGEEPVDDDPLAPLAGLHELDVATGLQYVLDDREIYLGLLRLFAESDYGKLLQESIDAGDAVALRRAAHSIKGGAATIGATALSLAAAELEARVVSGLADEAQSMQAGPLHEAASALAARTTRFCADLEAATREAAADAASAPERSDEDCVEAAPARIAEIVATVEHQLTLGDIAVRELLEAHRGLLRNVLGERFAHFEERIGNFDFETALDDLRAADAARKDTQAR